MKILLIFLVFSVLFVLSQAALASVTKPIKRKALEEPVTDSVLIEALRPFKSKCQKGYVMTKRQRCIKQITL